MICSYAKRIDGMAVPTPVRGAPAPVAASTPAPAPAPSPAPSPALTSTRPRTPALPPGFTLIELLVVLAILGMIAAFAGPQVFKYLGGARSDTARIQIENLSSGIDLYKLEVATYPPTLEGLVTSPAGVERWNGPYLRKRVIPKDPWGNEYIYRFPGEYGPYDLFSLGADNAEGGEGEDRDIVSWE